jgi:hypothetical protein
MNGIELIELIESVLDNGDGVEGLVGLVSKVDIGLVNESQDWYGENMRDDGVVPGLEWLPEVLSVLEGLLSIKRRQVRK